jgi:hypothetical protein
MTEREKWGARPLLLLAGLSVVCILAAAPRADAFVYWANGGGNGGSTIGRANNDGSAPNPNFITGQKEPCGLAVDSQHVYWANQGGSSIGRANLDGSGVDPSFIPGAVLPCGVALDGQNHIWWANQATGGGNTGSIAVANLDGSNPHVMYSGAGFVDEPRGVGANSSFVYWSNAPSPSSIGRGGLDGTPPPDKDFIPLADNFQPAWPTLSGDRLYFAATFGTFSTDLEGQDALVVGSLAYGGIAVFESKVYWANVIEGTLSRANLDLSSPEFAFMTGLGKPTGLALDGGSAPPASQPAKTKKRCKKKKKKHRAAEAKKKKKCKKKKRRK